MSRIPAEADTESAAAVWVEEPAGQLAAARPGAGAAALVWAAVQQAELAVTIETILHRNRACLRVDRLRAAATGAAHQEQGPPCLRLALEPVTAVVPILVIHQLRPVLRPAKVTVAAQGKDTRALRLVPRLPAAATAPAVPRLPVVADMEVAVPPVLVAAATAEAVPIPVLPVDLRRDTAGDTGVDPAQEAATPALEALADRVEVMAAGDQAPAADTQVPEAAAAMAAHPPPEVGTRVPARLAVREEVMAVADPALVARPRAPAAGTRVEAVLRLERHQVRPAAATVEEAEEDRPREHLPAGIAALAFRFRDKILLEFFPIRLLGHSARRAPCIDRCLKPSG
jgi:hypothetical protein